jgi:hypothetical protein
LITGIVDAQQVAVAFPPANDIRKR